MTTPRMSVDCGTLPGFQSCTLSVSGTLEETVRAVCQHLSDAHGDPGGPALEIIVRAAVRDGVDPDAHRGVAERFYGGEDRSSGVLFTAGAELRDTPSGSTVRGTSAIVSFLSGWAQAFPDATIEVSRVEPTKRGAVVEFTFRGTQTGALETVAGRIPPSGSRVVLEVCDVLEMDEGRVSALRTYYDAATLLVQLAVIPTPPASVPN